MLHLCSDYTCTVAMAVNKLKLLTEEYKMVPCLATYYKKETKYKTIFCMYMYKGATSSAISVLG